VSILGEEDAMLTDCGQIQGSLCLVHVRKRLIADLRSTGSAQPKESDRKY
jgi:hypothetical protein